MHRTFRFWLAALLAPLSVPIFTVLLQIPASAEQLSAAIQLAPQIAIVTYLGILIIGLPYALILRRLGILSLAPLFVGGLSAMVAVVFGLIANVRTA